MRPDTVNLEYCLQALAENKVTIGTDGSVKMEKTAML
jgi:hypothetical protein